ncbi:hypothetical protein GCM10008909_14940 [Hathewaya limosa]
MTAQVSFHRLFIKLWENHPWNIVNYLSKWYSYDYIERNRKFMNDNINIAKVLPPFVYII